VNLSGLELSSTVRTLFVAFRPFYPVINASLAKGFLTVLAINRVNNHSNANLTIKELA
jgi:hypothetical protein